MLLALARYGMLTLTERGVQSNEILLRMGLSAHGTNVLKDTCAITKTMAARRRFR